MDMNFDPEEPGRGPGRMGHNYRWLRVGDFPIMGRFKGVVLGTTKSADTLLVDCKGLVLPIRYEHLVGCVRIEECPKCQELTLERRDEQDWECTQCGTLFEHDPTGRYGGNARR